MRPYLIAPLRITVPDKVLAATNGQTSPGAGVLDPRDWVLSNQTINATGHVIGQDGAIGNSGGNIGIGPHGVDIQGLTCPNIALAKGRPLNPALANTRIQRCVDQYRIRELVIYQPASRYWALQWYETAIFLGAAVVLGGFCFWWSRRRRSGRPHVRLPQRDRAPVLERSA